MLGSLPLGSQGVGGEPQELGSDILNAILVGDTTGGTNPDANESGRTTLQNNNSTTPGPNEPANHGAPVWFYWRQDVLTHPVGGGLTDRTLTEVRMRFGVRYRPNIINANQTNFPTEMAVFKALRWPVTGYGDLQQLFINPRVVTDRSVRATRYAYWEDQSQVEFDAGGLPYDSLGRVGIGSGGVPPQDLATLDSLPGKGYYYIRVDSALLAGGGIKRGQFTLWWEMADRGAKPTPLTAGGVGGCAFCAPATTSENGACVLTFQPNVIASPPTDTQTYPLFGGNAPAATYVMSYCGGAWNYFFGWSVGQIPPGADQTWSPGPGVGDPPTEPGWFFSWQYSNGGVQYAHFVETFVSSGTDTWTTPRGYKSAAMAEDRMGSPPPGGDFVGCPQVFFQHDGGSPITLRWTDELEGNSPGPTGPPVYTLARVLPVFEASYACGNLVSGSTYDVTFLFFQHLNFNFTGVTCTCLLQGGVTASNTITGQTAFYTDSGLPPSVNSFTLRITVDGTLHKQVLATLQFSDLSGILGTLTFDLAPYVVITGQTLFGSSCVGYAETVFFTFSVRGLQADNLTLEIDPLHTVTSGIADSSCSSTISFNFGGVGCAGTGLNFKFNRTVSPTDIPLFWTDGAQSLPPSLLFV